MANETVDVGAAVRTGYTFSGAGARRRPAAR